jgi:hypothetical protein
MNAILSFEIVLLYINDLSHFQAFIKQKEKETQRLTFGNDIITFSYVIVDEGQLLFFLFLVHKNFEV